MRPRAVAKPSPRWAAMVVLVTSRGCPRVVTSNMLSPAPSSKLENLMGFFSSLGGWEAGAGATAADMTLRDVANKGGPDQGRRVLLRGRTEGRGVGGARNAGLDDREWWWRRWWCAVEAIRRFD